MESFDPTRFRTLLRTSTFGRTLIYEPSVGSTMDVARDAARAGAAEGTLVLADEQTAGRGRMGRSWVTPAALNLATTLVLRPRTSLLREVAMMAPLAICHAVEEVSPVRCDVKWPNDVQARGKKLAGVLIETDLGGDEPLALVGVGINVNFDPREYEEISDIATSLLAETGHRHDREALLAAYLRHFERLYQHAASGMSARAAWRERMVTLGQRVTVSGAADAFEGVAEDVDNEGALLVRRDDGTLVTVEAGDVTLRR